MNNTNKNLKNYLDQIRSKALEETIIDAGLLISQEIKRCIADKKLIIICGNGGSSADAEHWAGELICTYKRRGRKPIPVIALTSNPCVITAWANDVDYTTVFSRQIEAYENTAGLCITLSTSGKSENILDSLRTLKNLTIKSLLISGSKAPDNKYADLHVKMPSEDTAVIQTMTQILYHYVCDLLE